MLWTPTVFEIEQDPDRTAAWLFKYLEFNTDGSLKSEINVNHHGLSIDNNEVFHDLVRYVKSLDESKQKSFYLDTITICYFERTGEKFRFLSKSSYELMNSQDDTKNNIRIAVIDGIHRLSSIRHLMMKDTPAASTTELPQKIRFHVRVCFAKDANIKTEVFQAEAIQLSHLIMKHGSNRTTHTIVDDILLNYTNYRNQLVGIKETETEEAIQEVLVHFGEYLESRNIRASITNNFKDYKKFFSRDNSIWNRRLKYSFAVNVTEANSKELQDFNLTYIYMALLFSVEVGLEDKIMEALNKVNIEINHQKLCKWIFHESCHTLSFLSIFGLTFVSINSDDSFHHLFLYCNTGTQKRSLCTA